MCGHLRDNETQGDKQRQRATKRDKETKEETSGQCSYSRCLVSQVTKRHRKKRETRETNRDKQRQTETNRDKQRDRDKQRLVSPFSLTDKETKTKRDEEDKCRFVSLSLFPPPQTPPQVTPQERQVELEWTWGVSWVFALHDLDLCADRSSTFKLANQTKALQEPKQIKE